MFFFFGINNESQKLDFHQTIICRICGRYGSYEVYMTCMVFSVFLIPLFRWNRKYYVKTSCCGSVYELDPAIGKRIARGESVSIQDNNLYLLQKGNSQNDSLHAAGSHRKCPNCGYTTDDDFSYCPKCGAKLEESND
jgi:hypothetical protein